MNKDYTQPHPEYAPGGWVQIIEGFYNNMRANVDYGLFVSMTGTGLGLDWTGNGMGVC